MTTEYLNYIAGVSRSNKLARIKKNSNKSLRDGLRSYPDIKNHLSKKSHKIDQEKTRINDDKKSLLIAESDPGVLAILKMYLSAMGYSYEIVTDGALALERIEHKKDRGKKPYDVIIIDTHLDKLPGLNVAKEIHKNDMSQRIMIISTTPKKQLNVKLLRRAKVKEEDIFTKPFRLSELLYAIER